MGKKERDRDRDRNELGKGGLMCNANNINISSLLSHTKSNVKTKVLTQ